LYIGNTTAYTLTGLTPAQMYRFDVSAVSAEGYVGPITSTQKMFFSSLGDADHDGIPDQWATVFGLTGADALATADPDHDTVLNLREYELGSFPNQYDSNDDGYSDGEAVDFGLDPCGLQSPPYHQRPRPTLASTSLFKFATSINNPKLDPQVLTIANFGDGSFDWTADKSAGWITLDTTRGTAPANLLIGTDLTGLAVGKYTGVVTVTTTSALLSAAPSTTTDQAVIEVTLDVLPVQLLNIYLPIVLR
jgi:hypothetical protein